MKNENCQQAFSEGYAGYAKKEFICPYEETDPNANAWYDGWWNAKMNETGLSLSESRKYFVDI